MECNIDGGTKKRINITFISFLLNKNVVQRAFFRKKKLEKPPIIKKLWPFLKSNLVKHQYLLYVARNEYNLSKSHC